MQKARGNKEQTNDSKQRCPMILLDIRSLELIIRRIHEYREGREMNCKHSTFISGTYYLELK